MPSPETSSKTHGPGAAEPFEPPILQRHLVFDCAHFRVRRVRMGLPGGFDASFYLREEPDVAVCLPVSPQGQLVVVQEFRPGPGRWLTEIPGGVVDPGETPLAAAVREVREETGYHGQAVHLGSTWISAYSTARKHIFLMRGATPAGPPQPCDGELSRVLLLSRPQFEEVLRRGDLTDLYAGLLCLPNLD
jgi:ADP-ribose pyrophosphatase